MIAQRDTTEIAAKARDSCASPQILWAERDFPLQLPGEEEMNVPRGQLGQDDENPLAGRCTASQVAVGASKQPGRWAWLQWAGLAW